MISSQSFHQITPDQFARHLLSIYPVSDIKRAVGEHDLTKYVTADLDECVNDKHKPYLEANNWLQIFFGGSSSGKSVFLAQRTVKDIVKGGRNYLIIRNISNTMRDSVFNEIRKIITEWNLKDYFTIRVTDMLITCKNGYQIMFKGLDDVEKLKSITPEKGVITDVWIEEATETKETDVKQLLKRLRGGDEGFTKRITLSFNPIMRTHWIYKSYFGDYVEGQVLDTEALLIVHSTYKDNRFLTTQDIQFLENEQDEYFYNVYTLGKWGILGNIIFKNWVSQDIKGDPVYQTFDGFRHGLDFGYSNDPTAYNKMYYHRATKTLYITDEINKRGITNDLIAEEIRPYCGTDIVTCDSAEPKSIAELRKNGINARGALKGKDSINFGIQWLQQQKIVIDVKCQETKNNFEQYHWMKNKDGEVLNVPADKDNDHIDGIRYAMEDLALPSIVDGLDLS
jgi:phage terminase large subunit